MDWIQSWLRLMPDCVLSWTYFQVLQLTSNTTMVEVNLKRHGLNHIQVHYRQCLAYQTWHCLRGSQEQDCTGYYLKIQSTICWCSAILTTVLCILVWQWLLVALVTWPMLHSLWGWVYLGCFFWKQMKYDNLQGLHPDQQGFSILPHVFRSRGAISTHGSDSVSLLGFSKTEISDICLHILFSSLKIMSNFLDS